MILIRNTSLLRVYTLFTRTYSMQSTSEDVFRECRLYRIVYPSSAALASAIKTDNLKAVDILIELGVDVDDPKHDPTFYIILTEFRNLDIARSLLRAGACGKRGIGNGFGVLGRGMYGIREVCKIWDDSMIEMIFDNIPKGQEITPDFEVHLLAVTAPYRRNIFWKLLSEHRRTVKNKN